MKHLRIFLSGTLCLALASPYALTQTPPALDGTFDTTTGWRGIDGTKTIEIEKGNRFLRFKNEKPEEVVAVEGRIPLQPTWKRVTMSVKMRGTLGAKGKEGWYAPRLTFQFQNAENKMVGDWPNVIQLETSSAEWMTVSRDYEVPEGATSIFITPGLWGTAGVLDFDDLVVKVADGATAKGTSATMPLALATNDAKAPAGQELTWGSEPVEVQSTTRSRIVLNGVWKWMPANGATPDGGWGLIRVPGSWKNSGLPGIVAQGTGNDWKDFDTENSTRGWYERPLQIPANWAGRHIELDVARVSTDAQVWVNGQRMGQINWPAGTVDITSAVKAGQAATLRMLVVAVPNEGDVLQYMDGDDIIRRKASLHTAGIIGDVILQSSPQNARIQDVFVQPSVRKKQLGIAVEVGGAKAGNVAWTARLLDATGREEKKFSGTTKVAAGNSTVQLKFPWANPRLWDVGQPNLYTLRLEAKGAGLSDDYSQKFGFREFWIEGRKYFLNGTEFRARPILGGDENGVREAVDYKMREMLDFGFNLMEHWPNDLDERSIPEFRSVLSASADALGLPITGILNNMGPVLGDWDKPGSRQRYEARMAADMKRFRNHPSIIMWGTTGNMFGWSDDQNPRKIGRRNIHPDNLQWNTRANRGREIIARMKTYDPTRPIFTHHGDDVGDVFTTNFYLNFIPLQERIEWLSEWATKGEMPFWGVEFGTPLYTTLLRGRAGYGPSQASEPLISEFSAIYLGADAYKTEPQKYREQIRARFKGDQEYTGWHHDPLIRNAPAFQELQSLFHKHTNRTWRTWGLSGGTIPWDNGYRLTEASRQELQIGRFVPGRLGVYKPSVSVISPEISQAGAALKANNSATLAYIGGAPLFTESSHNFRAGTNLQKQIVLLNDARTSQEYSFRWSAKVGGRVVGSGQGNGRLGVAETKFAPVRFVLPTIANAKNDGEIMLSATIGKVTHTDTFAFRVFAPQSVASRGAIAVFDPAGDTTKMLRGLGYTPQTWNGSAVPLLVIGRKALSGGAKLPASLESYVQNGGRAIVMGQDPAYLRDYLGFRTTYHPTRRVFRMSADHPVVAGLDDIDLRDWAGTGTLIEAYPTEYTKSKASEPYAGWHWGNRGSVASVAVEKPHRTGWRPLLEAEFDLAYSPLMELDLGRGRITLCTLDLEDQTGPDPAAERIARQLLNYTATAPLSPRVETVYLGGPKGQKTLQDLGVNFTTVPTLPATAKLAIIGEDASQNPTALEAFARNGGKVVFLARTEGAAGAEIGTEANFGGSLNVPKWPEAAGISVSELRWRTNGAARVLTSGAEIGADGQLARRVVGNGVMVWSQLDPSQFDADKNTFFRYTRWRQTRALSQILANAGASFEKDTRALRPQVPESDRINLATNDWKAILVNPLAPSPSPDKGHEDPGMSAAAQRLMAVNVDETPMQTVKGPGDWESYGAQWQKDGEGVLRKTFEIPAKWAGQDLTLSLGSVDDNETTYLDGVQLGSTSGWNQKRVYLIPAAKATAGKHVIAVRVWDKFGGGGLTSSADELYVKPVQSSVPATMYHADFRPDFDFGDDPYRYYRW
jgi:beta-galactosidase